MDERALITGNGRARRERAIPCAAQAQEKAKSPQQNKMAMCNKQAVGKTGDERKGFMKTCLSAKKDTQQSKS